MESINFHPALKADGARDLIVKVNFNKQMTSMELAEGSRVEDVLNRMGLYPDAHIVLRGKVPVPITERLRDSEEIRIIKVASGG